MKREVLRLYRTRNPGGFQGWESDFLALTARTPTLVIWGDRDPFIAKHFAERFNAQRVVHLPDVGHWPPVEAPAECAEAILPFLGSPE
jgi:pimeloyl-ACP methyl ester carboxylesterase